MSELITQEIFTDGQKNINAGNMNGIVGRATVQPDIIANKPTSATMDVADLVLVLKTDNTLAKSRFDTITNSVASTLPLADATKNGALRQVSGVASDYVGGDNNCHPLTTILPPGMLVDYASASIPTGWLLCDGRAISRTVFVNLFAAIGTVFGIGDGSTTFNIPNFAGRHAVMTGGSIPALGGTGGAATINLTTAQLPSHTHTITDQQHSHATVAHTHSDNGHTHSYTTPQGAVFGVQAGGSTTYLPGTSSSTGIGYASLTSAAPNTDARFTGITGTNAAGSGGAITILSPYVAVNKIIKT
jgi:microcystin-dependent protein